MKIFADFLLDCAGIAAGLVVYYTIALLMRRIALKQKRKRERAGMMEKKGSCALPRIDLLCVLLWLSTALWMALIFYLSAQPAKESSELSGPIAKALLDAASFLWKGNPPGFITDVVLRSDHFVRKAAHALEYLILGILVAASLKKLGVQRKHFAISLAVCVLYAASDEFHQAFVPGRGPLVSDVLLDAVSSLAGIALLRLR